MINLIGLIPYVKKFLSLLKAEEENKLFKAELKRLRASKRKSDKELAELKQRLDELKNG